ncbi:MAG: hypothetical protein DMG80_18060 [Acidobacteria bacterium]|nr:MAG: hypothetical protein DMG80_18060 [Acidobacteriota bacterium]
MISSAGLSPQREALAAETLRRTGRLRLRVHGESMLPALWPGDIVDIAACSLKDLSRDEIVLAYREGRFFLHRFLAPHEHDSFVTRGDSMPGPDPAFPADALLGKLTQVVRAGQTFTAPVRLWSRAIGIFFCYCSTARRAGLTFHNWRYSRELQISDPETA